MRKSVACCRNRRLRREYDTFRELSQEYAQLDPVVAGLAPTKQAKAISAMPKNGCSDPEMQDLAEAEIPLLREDRALENCARSFAYSGRCRVTMPIYSWKSAPAPAVTRRPFLPATCFRMYARYAEKKRWQLEILSANPGEHGGYREIIARVEGKGAYSRLKFESGTHRVQRVPNTETQGRIHTSAATVAILPEMDDIDDIDIAPDDIRTDTFRASGAGGQHVNKTDSAIRITHLPSGIVVECQDERSQHKNRARAMSLLKARLLDEQRAKQNAVQAESRQTAGRQR